MESFGRICSLILVLLITLGSANGQGPTTAEGFTNSQAGDTQSSKPAENLYLRLRRVGLNPAQTYRVRGANLSRPGFQISFEDGTIAFTNDILGHTTGAFFEGDGEVLLTPPNRVERASMALGTGMAILEERFATLYMRFNDDTLHELEPGLRAPEDATGFVEKWNSAAEALAELDALRLLETFSRWLPSTGAAGSITPSLSITAKDKSDRFLHARIDGRQLGAFDLHYDSTADEAVTIGQSKTKGGVAYYDVWASFAPVVAGGKSEVQAQEDWVRIQNYQIRTEVRPPTGVSVDAMMNVRIGRSGDRTLLFELSRFLQVRQVEADGRPVEFIQNQALEGTQLARRGNDLVAIVFAEPLHKSILRLHLTYGGDVLSDAGGGLMYVGARGSWYPSRGLFPADFDLTFRYPKSWTLIATGRRVAGAEEGVETGDDSAGEDVESHWRSDRPIALAGFNLGKYVKATAHAGEVPVETFAARGVERTFPKGQVPLRNQDLGQLRPGEEPVLPVPAPPAPAKHAQAVADEAAGAVDFFSQRFGVFPYDSLKLTQMPGAASQGWPGLIFLSSLAFLSPQEEENLRLSSTADALRRLMLAHETAHQWWGDEVLWKSYRDQWLVEALANYSALMKLETERPADFREILEKYRLDLLAKDKDDEQLREAGPVTLGQRLSNSHFPQGYEAISYGRGTWLFHMLRGIMLDASRQPASQDGSAGSKDDPFVRALHRVVERYNGKAIDTHELLAIFAEELPRSAWFEGRPGLDWFEQSWIEGTAIPQLTIRNVHITPKGAESSASGLLMQKDAPGDLVTSVPIYAMVGSTSVFVARLFADGPETPFHVRVPLGTTKLVLDPNRTLLKK